MINSYEDKLMINIYEATNIKPVKAEGRLASAESESSKRSEATVSVTLDSVSLSSDSKQLQALKASLADAPEINQARVDFFKNEIESGRYEINSRSIARNMLNLVETY